MKVDVVAVGSAGFRGRLGGSGLYNARVLALMPRYGLEVAYIPYPELLISFDPYLTAALKETIEYLERAGVTIPAFVHESLENEKLRETLLALLENKANVPFSASSWWPLSAIIFRSLQLAMAITGSIRWNYLGGLKAITYYYNLVSKEVNDGRSLLILSEQPSSSPVIAGLLKKPTYVIMHSNPYYWYSVPTSVYFRLGLLSMSRYWLGGALSQYPGFKLISSYYSDLAKSSAQLSGIWVNPVTYLRFKSMSASTASNFRRICFLYPGSAVEDQKIFEKRNYIKNEYVLFGAAPSVVKGFLDLPHILKYLNGKTDIKVLITANPTGEARSLARRLKEAYPYVEFVGFIEDKERLYELYANARALIYPSHMDSNPLAILNALGAATPVVAYGIPEFVYLYKDLKPVKLVREYDFKSFAEQLIKIIEKGSSKELFDDEKTVEFIKAHSSWNNVAEQLVRILSTGSCSRRS